VMGQGAQSGLCLSEQCRQPGSTPHASDTVHVDLSLLKVTPFDEEPVDAPLRLERAFSSQSAPVEPAIWCELL
ncbi:unnamed protein product, partial [Polarella glacialis]